MSSKAPQSAEPQPSSPTFWPGPVMRWLWPMLVVLAFFGTLMIPFGGLLVAATFFDVPDYARGSLLWSIRMAGLAVIFAIFSVLVVWFLAKKGAHLRLKDVGLIVTKHSPRALGLGLAFAAVAMLPAAAVMHFAGIGEHPDVVLGSNWTVLSGVVAGLAMALFLQGFPEELFFRGLLMNVYRAKPVVAVVISAVTFGIIHLTSEGGQSSAADYFWYLLGPTSFGFAAGAAALYTRSLWAAVGVHAGMHLVTNFVVLNTVDHYSAVWHQALSCPLWLAAGTWCLWRWHKTPSKNPDVLLDR